MNYEYVPLLEVRLKDVIITSPSSDGLVEGEVIKIELIDSPNNKVDSVCFTIKTATDICKYQQCILGYGIKGHFVRKVIRQRKGIR